LGRVTAEQQTPYKPASGTFLFLYSYDFLGNLTCRNNGFAALTATNSCLSLTGTASTISLRNQYDGFGRWQFSYTTPAAIVVFDFSPVPAAGKLEQPPSHMTQWDI
jgi:hypothetical protein